MISETAFEMAASSIRFGVGVTREVGADLKELGARRVLLVTDPIVREKILVVSHQHPGGGINPPLGLGVI